MDIKRLFFALILSFTFIITWNIFFPPDVPQKVGRSEAAKAKHS